MPPETTSAPFTTEPFGGFCQDGLCYFNLLEGGFTDSEMGQMVVGRENSDYPNVVEFSGIQYAFARRFMAPEAINNYGDTDFSHPGFSCANVDAVETGSESLPVDTERIEDCLYIRIWMRKDALIDRENRRKVLSWIHGGTFNFGGVDVIYESPAKLVDEQDLIVAKMNYRLGPFGNWYFPAGVNGQPRSGWAVQDQRMGLEWIKNHIGKFNGDANDITLGGASAGGMSVLIHVTSPESHHLFHNALVIGPPQIKFWSAEEAQMAYGFLSTNVTGGVIFFSPIFLHHFICIFYTNFRKMTKIFFMSVKNSVKVRFR